MRSSGGRPRPVVFQRHSTQSSSATELCTFCKVRNAPHRYCGPAVAMGGICTLFAWRTSGCCISGCHSSTLWAQCAAPVYAGDRYVGDSDLSSAIDTSNHPIESPAHVCEWEGGGCPSTMVAPAHTYVPCIPTQREERNNKQRQRAATGSQ